MDLLRQNVSEGGEDHVVGAVRGARYPGHSRSKRTEPRSVTKPVPIVSNEVGLLHPKLDRALRALVEPVPESQRAFHLMLGVVGAIAEATGNKSSAAAHAGCR